jgi:predicted DNA-binding WGR domain protein
MVNREFLFDDGDRQKFWEVAIAGSQVEMSWGRVGTEGQGTTRVLDSAAAASAHAERVIQQKVRKGYVETPHARFLRVRSEQRAASEALVFVETAGGPVLVVPAALASDWNGTFDPDGAYIFEQSPCDYDRACARPTGVSSLLVGSGHALIMGSIGPVAWHPRPDGGLLLLWGACDTTAALLVAASRILPSAYQRTRIRFTVGPDSEVVLLDAARRGRSPGSTQPAAHDDYRSAEAHRFKLRAGAYAVAYCAVRRTVIDGERKVEVSAEVVKLMRVRQA